jgi:tellurite resistance protein
MAGFSELVKRITDTAGRTPEQALVNAMCLSIASDGEVTDEELEQALGMAMDLPGLAGKQQDEVEGYVARAFDQLKSEGMDTCMKNVARMLEGDERMHAFTLAAAVQYIDGKITDQENDFLAAFRDMLEIEPDRADAIIADIEKDLK